MLPNSPADNHQYPPFGEDGFCVGPAQPQRGQTPDVVWTPEVVLEQYQRDVDLHWARHGLSMNHSSVATTHLSAGSQVPISQGYTVQSSSIQGHQSGGTSSQAYQVLPQQQYIAKRRYHQQPPILFRTEDATGCVRLIDAMHGRLLSIQGADDAVITGDNLSQKQSIRLEIPGCRSYEKQINVRNPTNNLRSISRKKLAEKIAKEIYDFMKRHQGPFGDPALGLGPGTNGFERIVLLELRHVSRSSWQPVLGVLH